MVRRLHLATGLILFTYVFVHFVNHALAVFSLAAADRMLVFIYPVLTSGPVTALLLDALLLHVALALRALWLRRTLRLSPYEAVQYLLGFAVPLLLAPHVMSTRIADSVFGADFGYYRNVLYQFWRLRPGTGVAQAALLLCAWIHACIGLRFWLRLRPWYPAAQPVLFGIALILPSLAMAGFIAGGNEATLRAVRDPGFVAGIFAAMPSPAARARIETLIWVIQVGMLLAIGAVLVARALRREVQRRQGLIAITYPDGRCAKVPRGFSVLEASRFLGIPHASVCGGRGRCSTCRIQVVATAALPPPSPEEQRVLQRIHAGPGIRLACQLRPQTAITVTPLLDAARPAGELLRHRHGNLLGVERDIAILFADLRDFTRLSEHRLPFDVVHLLNRYFRSMGEAVEQAGGRVDKFIGDGVMALFGTDQTATPCSACRAALAAARLLSQRLEDLNRSLRQELGEELRIGIGVHAGTAIVGEMGYGQATTLTAIGDAVNTASRLESACKTFNCEAVVSETVFELAAVPPAGDRHDLVIRGRREPLAVRTLPRAADLPGQGKRL